MTQIKQRRFWQQAGAWAFGLCAMGASQLASVPAAHAFCGFYVSGGTSELFNNATQVVLMRDGTKTVLSMQNNYQGPTSGFAMVVPVPVVLQKENVKTLSPDLFKKIDTLSAPRLVEYWERDPCKPDDRSFSVGAGGSSGSVADAGASVPPAVKVEAKFEVGEYQIVVLSSTEATALETWLKTNQFNIPQGAAPLFEQYIQQGQYFFVAKVDPAKVTFKEGRAVLSPLRFDYDSTSFALPVRMGMVNSKGEQDLIVYVVSREGRFEVANYPNTTIPTNIEVAADVRKDFPIFFTKLIDATLQKTPNAVITEYSWDASTCDPCPGPTLDQNDFATLGADVLAGGSAGQAGFGFGWTLTRLHARYSKGALADDLVFRKASGIVGGREVSDQGRLETGAKPNSFNNFQGRYIMRNRWKGEVACAKPMFGRWGGPPTTPNSRPPTQTSLSPNNSGATEQTASQSALAQRSLASLLAQDVPDIGVKADSEPKTSPPGTTRPGEVSPPTIGDKDAKSKGGGCSFADGAASASTLSLLGLMALLLRRRRS